MKKLFLSLAGLILAASQICSAQQVLSLDDALKIALSENASVKVADLEIERTGYARKGSYAALFPQVDGTANYQRTIKKQVMYMDFDIPGMGGGGDSSSEQGGRSRDGFEVGRWNTWSTGVSASMPLVNAQLWKSIQISGQDVELAVEKARSSRLETVTQVKKAFFTVLLAKEAQLKAVMGVALDSDIDVAGSLADYADAMLTDPRPDEDLSGNSTLRQLDIQARQLASSIKLQQYASLPSLALAFSYSLNAMTNDFKFSEYKWSPYSYVGLSLNIPIFAGGKRYHAVKAAKVQAAELDIQRANTERQLQIAVRQYLGTMETAIKSHASASSAVETATKAYGIARKSYDVGRSTLTDLNDAQLALTQSQLGVCQAIYNYLSAKSDLEGTLGADFLDKTANNE